MELAVGADGVALRHVAVDDQPVGHTVERGVVHVQVNHRPDDAAGGRVIKIDGVGRAVVRADGEVGEACLLYTSRCV